MSLPKEKEQYFIDDSPCFVIKFICTNDISSSLKSYSKTFIVLTESFNRFLYSTWKVTHTILRNHVLLVFS